MKHLLATWFLACTIAEAIPLIRPGAQWNVRGNGYQGIEWLDTTQVKPTPQEIVVALQNCQSTIDARILAKRQARLDVKNSTLTQAQRFQALMILLDYDQ